METWKDMMSKDEVRAYEIKISREGYHAPEKEKIDDSEVPACEIRRF